jgi:hypothetical protein
MVASFMEQGLTSKAAIEAAGKGISLNSIERAIAGYMMKYYEQESDTRCASGIHHDHS